MIPNQWYAILETREVKKGKLTGVTRMGEKLVAWRDSQGLATVMVDQCPHRGVQLSIGKLTDDCVRCPFHGFEFDRSGACTLIPANGKNARPPKALSVRTYPTQETNGLIFIWWGQARETYPPLPALEGLTDDFTYGTFRQHWSAHYSRAIENQLDVVHLPFVHYNTIGAGGATVVNGPLTRTRQAQPGSFYIEAWVNNEVEHGQTPRKPAELAEPHKRPSLQFCFPNLWQLLISDDFRVFVAFAPIDDEHTMMYVRQYHKNKIPILRELINFFGNLGNRVIVGQDQRVVITQQPKRSALNMAEKLIPGDAPIIAYRRIRQKLINGESLAEDKSSDE
jgi:phenylpropionate dioxygenase-like ring-hydroxylating dioxygenase large terminal subunit